MSHLAVRAAWLGGSMRKLCDDKLYYMKETMTEPEIIVRKGRPVSVILPIKEYEELLERAEDSGDVAWLKRARRKPMQYRSLEEYLSDKKSKSRV
jgi:prevent-host-death family protein